LEFCVEESLHDSKLCLTAVNKGLVSNIFETFAFLTERNLKPRRLLSYKRNPALVYSKIMQFKQNKGGKIKICVTWHGAKYPAKYLH